MIPLYQTRSIRDLETRLYEEKLCDPEQLMENAGHAAFEVIKSHWSHVRHLIVFCGKGNNGGDGLVVARLAYEQGWQVDVYSTITADDYSGVAAIAAHKALSTGVEIKQCQSFDASFSLTADVIVDALLGTGLQAEVKEPYASIINAINASETPVLAIDIPSGLEADTGHILGCAIQADVTITFIALKQGLLTGKSPAYAGQLICNDLGIPQTALSTLLPSAYQMTWSHVKRFLPRRKRSAHKGDYGHVLVIGGDYGMGGAVRMAAEAAMRVGAGLVSVATRPEHVPIVSSSRPEIMCHQINDATDLQPLITRATVIVLGPGLGKSDWAKNLFNLVLQFPMPKVIDADALNILASQQPVTDASWILTPHPGEAARLLQISNQAVQQNRFQAAYELQQRYQGVVVLKGAGTIIQLEKQLPIICGAGNPGMATGGMGDILSGIIGGLLAQQLTLAQAAEVGVMIHALAADRAAEQGGERGLLATDLLGYLRELVNPF